MTEGGRVVWERKRYYIRDTLPGLTYLFSVMRRSNMWSSLLCAVILLSARSSADEAALTEAGGEVKLGDDVTITVPDDNGDGCLFQLQLPQCCYTTSGGGDCEGADQSPDCNSEATVVSKNRNCVLTLPDFKATDAGTYGAEGERITVTTGAGSGLVWWHVALPTAIIATLSGVFAGVLAAVG